MQIAPTDMRPTGPTQLSKAALDWQRHLNRQVRHGVGPRDGRMG